MKGVIAKVSGGKAVLLSEHSEFLHIKNRQYAVGQTIEYHGHSFQKHGVMAASLLLFFMMGYAGYALCLAPVTYVSVDINPSMRLDMNRFDRVIHMEPLNEDAKNLISLGSVHATDVNECIHQIIQSAEQMGYLGEQNNMVEINVVSPHSKVVQKVKDSSAQYEERNVHVLVEQADTQSLKEAKKLDISIGRLKSLREYTEAVGGELTEHANTLKKESNVEIKKRAVIENIKKNAKENLQKPSENITKTPEPSVTQQPKVQEETRREKIKEKIIEKKNERQEQEMEQPIEKQETEEPKSQIEKDKKTPLKDFKDRMEKRKSKIEDEKEKQR